MSTEIRFPVHTIQTAPERARPFLEQILAKYGFVPNLYGVFAEAPVALAAYLAVSDCYTQASLPAAAREVVLLTVSRENGCSYCMAVHSTTARRQKVANHVIDAIRDDRPIDDAALQAVRVFTRTVVQNRGWVDDADIRAFLAAGYQRPHVLEVLVGVTLKTLSNYTNHLAHPPVDDAFRAQAWTAPGGSGRRE